MTTPTARIDLPMHELRAFCERWGIVRFALFGSVLREDFGPQSDIDVLTWFDRERGPRTILDHIRMESALSELLGRKAEVVSYEALMEDPNVRRREEIEESSRIVIEA
jgi:uncharacterized protein